MGYFHHKFIAEGMADLPAYEKACKIKGYQGPLPLDKTRTYKHVMQLSAQKAANPTGVPVSSLGQATSVPVVPVVRPKPLKYSSASSVGLLFASSSESILENPGDDNESESC